MIDGSADEAGFASRRWRFGEPGLAPLAPQMVLFEDGRIGASDGDAQRHWRLDSGVLLLLDRDGAPSVRFDRLADRNRVWRLDGRMLGRDAPVTLQEVAPAQLPADEHVAVDPRRVGGDRPERRFTVLVRAGDGSRHAEWERDIPDQDRSWDLCLSYYGSDPDGAQAGCDLFCHQPKPGALMAFHRLLHERSILWASSHLMVCDERLRLRWSDVNRIFARMVEHDLLLAQPGFSAASHLDHELGRARPHSLLRHVSVVGKMAPVFRRSLLQLVAPTFGGLEMGGGIEHLWSFMAGRPPGRIAVLDDVVVDFTGPADPQFDPFLAASEERVLRRLYGFTPLAAEFGSIPR